MNSRINWINLATKIARPVLAAMADGQLKAQMPVEARPGCEAGRSKVTHLEALGRTLAGIAPWLELENLEGEEEALRSEFADLARRSIAHATDPSSPDFVLWTGGGQPVVDAAFLCHALIRAPRELWEKLDGETQNRLIDCLKATRETKPPLNNWLLFIAIIEAFLMRIGAGGDKVRLDYAIVKHEEWYLGDGAYGDGPEFHFDYYNSFVIQPMLLDCLSVAGEKYEHWKAYEPRVLQRAQRFAAVQERLIGPDGSYPILGRSICYRSGAFQLLAQMALQNQLPPAISLAQVRCALWAMTQRLFEAPGTFDENGWLQIGFCGHQPDLAESYISTGSLYLCLTSFLPLGLSPQHEFWAAPDQMWTSKRIYGGEDLPADGAIYGGKLH
jgi:hypothetical protein